MDHHVAQIDQHPFTGGLAFHVHDIATGGFHLVAYRRRQCLGLPVRGARGNRDPIKHAGQVGSVIDVDVLGFHILERVNDERL